MPEERRRGLLIVAIVILIVALLGAAPLLRGLRSWASGGGGGPAGSGSSSSGSSSASPWSAAGIGSRLARLLSGDWNMGEGRPEGGKADDGFVRAMPQPQVRDDPGRQPGGGVLTGGLPLWGGSPEQGAPAGGATQGGKPAAVPAPGSGGSDARALPGPRQLGAIPDPRDLPMRVLSHQRLTDSSVSSINTDASAVPLENGGVQDLKGPGIESGVPKGGYPIYNKISDTQQQVAPVTPPKNH